MDKVVAPPDSISEMLLSSSYFKQDDEEEDDEDDDLVYTGWFWSCCNPSSSATLSLHCVVFRVSENQLSFWASDTPVSSFQASDTSSWVPRFRAFWYKFQASQLLKPIPSFRNKFSSFWDQFHWASKFLNTNSKLPSFWYTNFKASKPLIPIPSLQAFLYQFSSLQGCWYQLSSSQAFWYRFSSLQAFWYQFSRSQAFWYLPDVLLIWFLQVRWICIFKE